MPSTIEMTPQLALFLQLLSGGAATTTTTGTPAPTLPQDLADLLGGIPIAHDGHVITAEHHNSLRDAIGLLAKAVEVEELAKVQTLTFTPVLLEEAEKTPWRLDVGIAKGPDVAQAEQAYGWMPIDLPQGARIEGVTVRGSRQGTPSTWSVTLVRQEIATGTRVNFFYFELQELPEGPFSKNIQIGSPEDLNMTAAQIEQLRQVDKSRYRYLFYTVVEGAASGGDITLSDVEVTCGRS